MATSGLKEAWYCSFRKDAVDTGAFFVQVAMVGQQVSLPKQEHPHRDISSLCIAKDFSGLEVPEAFGLGSPHQKRRHLAACRLRTHREIFNLKGICDDPVPLVNDDARKLCPVERNDGSFFLGCQLNRNLLEPVKDVGIVRIADHQPRTCEKRDDLVNLRQCEFVRE